MKVTGVETFPIAVPSPHPGGPYWMLLRLDTDEGISGVLILEGIERFESIYDELTDPPFTWRDGFIIPSERPGLGHDLREDVARSLRPDGPGRSLIRSY